MGADLWRAAIYALFFTALALASRDEVAKYLTPPPTVRAPQAFIGMLFLLGLVVMSLVAITPLLAVRLFDRRR
jgi:hypothetical protein